MMSSPVIGLLLISGDPCFAEVARLPLLHRILLGGCKAGVREWLLLTQHEAQRVRSSLAAEARLKDVAWQVYDLAHADAASITAAVQGRDVFVIACSAVFDHRVLVELQQAEGTVLCVTASKATPPDLRGEGLTVQQGRVSMDATTTSSPAYEATGILRCPGEILAPVMQETWEIMQRTSRPLSVILPRLVDLTCVKPLDISQHVWVPLTTPLEASVATAESRLISKLGRDGDSPIIRFLNRRVSQALTKRLARTAVTPNQITLLSALVGLSGAIFLAQPLPLLQVLGSLFFVFSTIVDGCDGEIARLTFQESDFGAKFDVIMDNVVHLFLFPCIALGLYRQEPQALTLLLGGLLLLGTLISMAMYVPQVWSPPAVRSPHLRLHESLASRDFALALPVLALLGKLNWFLWAATIGTYLFALALGGIYLYQRWQQWTLAKTR